MSQSLIIEDYIAQTKKYREECFDLYGPTPRLVDFLAMPYNQQISAISEKLQTQPPSDELVSDYLAWVPREQIIIDTYNDKTTPFKGSWWLGNPIIQFDTYTVSTMSDSVKILTVAMKEALLNGSHRACGYIESVDDQKRWGYLFHCVDYENNGQSVEVFLNNAVASITEQNTVYAANVNGTAVSQDMSGVAFLRKGTCYGVIVRTLDYVNPHSESISGYHHNFSMIDSSNFDLSHKY